MTNDGDLPPDLRAENARLVALLESHSIEWRRTATVDVQHTPSALNTDQKVALFRRLFRGRTDLYPVRWESKAGKTGYAPGRSLITLPGGTPPASTRCSPTTPATSWPSTSTMPSGARMRRAS
jgi:hypothetical protein